MTEKHDETEHLAQNWQQQLSGAFTCIDDLCGYLRLSKDQLPLSTAASQSFALRVPLSFAASMEKGNPQDPLLRQVLPVADELHLYPGFSDDPVGDLSAVAEIGVLHKYQGRVLLINTGSCAINCRYCFRRNFPYAQIQLGKQKQQAALDYIAADHSITEVILSGGDPLLLNDAQLGGLIQQINPIGHVQRIRIHSRLPIVLPARITDELVAILASSGKTIIMVVHCNHANELSPRVTTALKLLKSHGITVFNQAVLLSGVNDDAKILCQLSEQLFKHGVIPYYLHLLDKVRGAGHFEVGLTEALRLMQEVQTALPGYLVPKLVKEQAGAAYKRYAHDLL
ncbi:MAG: EF-P beta-lysylation protein EpmB [Methylovulum sp.]|uniref:EF-P beta-lysylation protein EpmB n=1 Tax=Methylovulum sp. TaxID=1916980 RepID=UPI00260329E9|nr:EF-P beta-lysylation protein EpmB [Methylovulum sp.]MDD2724619.1 EF-P beta-lysylation protein EpmB [Methylovulum sp.]MDD5126374.1 EF-P beta-lysylation protein EpmB [Methylovulum sp.]